MSKTIFFFTFMVMSLITCSNADAKKYYGKNILSITPLAVTNDGAAIGLSYERVLDRQQKMHFYLGTLYNYRNVDYNYHGLKSRYFMVYPGFKMYPTGSEGVLKYAIALSLFLASGNEYDVYYYRGGGGFFIVDKYNRFIIGNMFTNTLNIFAGKKIAISSEAGIGWGYKSSVGTRILAKAGINVGFRF